MRKRYLIAGLSVIVLGALVALGFYVSTVFDQPQATRKTGERYLVSLGDSVAAGAGLSDMNDGNKCDISSAAYPVVLGKQLQETVKQLACSGAIVGKGANSLTSTQYPYAKPYLAGSDVVVTAGANDIGWLQALEDCAQSSCQNLDTSGLSGKIAAMQQDLTQLLQQIQQAHPHKVVVNEYYSLLDPGDTCFENLGITPAKIATVAALQDRLNGAISTAAKAAGAAPVQIDFSGHLLCSNDSYLQKLADNAPLHPTAAGQRQIAAQDAAAFTGSPK